MKQKKKLDLQHILILAGIVLLVAAGAMMIFWQWTIHAAQKQSQEYVHTLRTLMPEPQSAILEERRDNSMSALSLDGTDFIGILEFPLYGSALPVCGHWGNTSRY